MRIMDLSLHGHWGSVLSVLFDNASLKSQIPVDVSEKLGVAVDESRYQGQN